VAYQAGIDVVEKADLPPLLVDLANVAVQEDRLLEAEELVRRAVAILPDDAQLQAQLEKVLNWKSSMGKNGI
jgi:hypothetical protein